MIYIYAHARTKFIMDNRFIALGRIAGIVRLAGCSVGKRCENYFRTSERVYEVMTSAREGRVFPFDFPINMTRTFACISRRRRQSILRCRREKYNEGC